MVTSVPPNHHTIPEHLFSLSAYELEAQQQLDPKIWAYLSGAAGFESTLSHNLNSFLEIKLCPRMLANVKHGNTATTLLGHSLTHPVILAPIAYQTLFHHQGELATVDAANATQTPMIVSHFASTPFADIAKRTHQPHWFQLYWHGSRDDIKAQLDQAEQLGFSAIVLTVDAAHSGIRYREMAAGFNLPNNILSANHIKLPTIDPKLSVFDGLMLHAPLWDDVTWLTANTALPVLIKGILNPLDAQHVKAVGARGVILSNHGGRILDHCISPLEILPTFRTLLGDDFPILLDSGIRSGADVFKALALGANAVLLGRPYIYGLAVAGNLGAAHVIKLVLDELALTMALCGCRHINDINSTLISHPFD